MCESVRAYARVCVLCVCVWCVGREGGRMCLSVRACVRVCM